MWRGTRPLPRDPIPAAPATPSSVSPSASAAPPEPTAMTVHSAVASLVDAEFYECSDLVTEEPPEVAAAFAKQTDAGPQFIFDQELEYWHQGEGSTLGDSLERQHKGSKSGLRPKGVPQLLKKPCDEQFARPVIASCKLKLEASPVAKLPPIKMQLRLAYYLIPEDSVMSQCIAVGGDWSELDRDSREYLHAKTQESRRLLMKTLAH